MSYSASQEITLTQQVYGICLPVKTLPFSAMQDTAVFFVTILQSTLYYVKAVFSNMV
jgi:hypothetical protein